MGGIKDLTSTLLTGRRATEHAVDNAASAIHQTLTEVKAFLAQEAPPKLSEADTKAYFIEPILRALGWVGIGVVTREYYVRNSQEFIDYVLRGPSSLVMAIETKKLQDDLTDKHAAQLIQYCAVEGIEWAALTNGRELQFFNTFLKRDLAAKRVMHLDLLAFNSDEEFVGIFAQLWQLSLAQMTAPSGVRTWMHQRRMDASLRQILANPGSAVMAHLRAQLAEAEIPATEQDLVAWFRGNLSARAGILVPGADTFGTAPNPDPSPGPTGKVDGTDNRPQPPDEADRGRLWPLVEADLLPAGTRLVVPRGGKPALKATVDEAGRIRFGQETYRSPSDKTFARLLGRQSLNGWREWRAEVPGGLVSLDDLRQRLSSPSGGDEQASA